MDPKVETEWISALRRTGVIKKCDETDKPFTDWEYDQKMHVSSYYKEKIQEEERKTKKEDDEEDLLANLDEEDDDLVFAQYRQRRLLDFQMEMDRKKFGEVMEITKQNYVEEVNNAGQDIWVILHVYKTGNMLCSLLNQFLSILAPKFKHTKFIKSIVDLCIPNFPEENLPAIFIYQNGKVVRQFLGQNQIGDTNMKCEDLEWILSKVGAIKTDLESDPRKERAKREKFVMAFGEDSD